MPDSTAPPAPPLCVMSVSLRTIIDTDDKSNEIVSASTSVYHEGKLCPFTYSIDIFVRIFVGTDRNILTSFTYNLVRLDDTVENNRKLISKETLIRKPKTSPFPPGFDTAVERSQGRIVKLPSERALLNRLLVRIHNTDPDVIVGHNFVGFDLDVLLHRMKHNKADHWSRIGRLRRTMYGKKSFRQIRNALTRQSPNLILSPLHLIVGPNFRAVQEAWETQQQQKSRSWQED